LLIGTGIFWFIEQWRLRHPHVSLTAPGIRSEVLDFGDQPSTFDPQKLQWFQSVSRLTLALGLCLILIGITLYVGYDHWVDTRIFKPLAMPVSFVPGHIKTGDFYINLHDSYQVYFGFDDAIYRTDCRLDAVKTYITLYREGQKLVEEESSGYLDGFYLDKGENYSLDIAILQTANCPNTLHPQLIVSAYDGDYKDWKSYIQWISGALVLAGAGLICYSVRVQISNRISRRTTEAAYESITRAYYPKVPKPLRKKFSGLPSFGLVGTLSISWLVFFFVVLAPWPQRGLLVHLVKPPRGNLARLVEPLVVYVQFAGITVVPRIYVNSKSVSWDQLRETLKAELGRRPEWVVYVKGDSNLAYAYVAEVVSIARDLQAKVVLLTPQTEFPQDPIVKR
jgi:biopolymer transport protein ExbD